MPRSSSTVPNYSDHFARWEWNSLKYRAAADVANITRRHLVRWKKHPQFDALVRGILGDVQHSARDEIVTTKAGRLRILIDLHNKLLAIIEARAERHADEREWAAGESTGLIVTKESVGNTYSREAAVDVALVKQIQSIQEQIAKELGQWDSSINVRHTGRVDHVHRSLAHSQLTDEQLEFLEAIALDIQAKEHAVVD
jgi:hypothetical protein